MKTIICTRYGPPEVLELKEMPTPVPRDNEVLIRVHATTVTIGDVRIRSADFPSWLSLCMRIGFGFKGPRKKILGEEVSGQIEAVGKDVRRFREGDQVFADTNPGLGAYAEYICLPKDGKLATKPANQSFAEAAAGPSATLSALSYLRKGNIRSGQKVLVYGASGALGVAAVQLAKYFGAEVTGVCSTANLELVKSLGADRVIDYTKEDWTEKDEAYDLVFDAVSKSSFSRSKRALKVDGVYLPSVPTLPFILRMLWTSMTGGKKVLVAVPKSTTEDLIFVKELVGTGKIRPVIDRCYPLEEIVEAHRYVDMGHKKGNVVITVAHIDESW